MSDAQRSTQPNQALLDAIRYQDLAAAARALNSGASLAARDEFGYGPLHIAAMHEDAAAIRWLALSGADFRQANAQGATPVLQCAAMGHLEAIKTLSTWCADLESLDQDLPGALEHALIGGHLACAAWLIRHGADIDAPSPQNGQTLLARRSLAGDEAGVRLLLEAGANPDDLDDAGDDPGTLARRGGHLAIAALIDRARALGLGTRPQATRNRSRFGPLAPHARARLLALFGAHGHARPWHVDTSLSAIPILLREGQAATRNGKLVGYIRERLAAGASPWVRDTGARGTLLHAAAAQAMLPVLRTVLDSETGAQVLNASDRFLDRPLHKAVAAGCIESVELLVNAGADVNAVNRAGFTPLHVACHLLAHEAAEFLIARGANPLLRIRSGLLPEEIITLRQASAARIQSALGARQAITAAKSIFSADNPLAASLRAEAARRIARGPGTKPS